MELNKLTFDVIGVAMRLHTRIGPGLLESAYEAAFAYELKKAGYLVSCQTPLPFIYEDVKLEVGYRVDLIVNNEILIELKSVEGLTPVHFAQTLTYLKISGLKVGLLINFNVVSLKGNVHRLINYWPEGEPVHP